MLVIIMRCVLPVYELHQLRPPFFYKHFATSQFEKPRSAGIRMHLETISAGLPETQKYFRNKIRDCFTAQEIYVTCSKPEVLRS